MNIQGRTTEGVNQRQTKFIKELLRQMLILAMILIGIVASSLPVAILFQSSDSSASESKKLSEASNANANVAIPVRQHDDRLTLVNDRNKQQHSKRKTAN